MWYIYIIKYYPALKNYIMKFAGKWLELEKNYPERDNPDTET